VIIYFGRPRRGTEQTLRFRLYEEKPYLLIDGREIDPGRAAERIAEFHLPLLHTTLDFAGPRASSEPNAYAYTTQAVKKFLELQGEIIRAR
jgi:hypothetical protein